MKSILQKGEVKMKSYIKQIYEEGLGKSIYVPLKKKIDRKTTGKTKEILLKLLKVIYMVIALFIAFLLFYIAYPFN